MFCVLLMGDETTNRVIEIRADGANKSSRPNSSRRLRVVCLLTGRESRQRFPELLCRHTVWLRAPGAGPRLLARREVLWALWQHEFSSRYFREVRVISRLRCPQPASPQPESARVAASMIRCTRCGNGTNRGDKICGRCGRFAGSSAIAWNAPRPGKFFAPDAILPILPEQILRPLRAGRCKLAIRLD